MASIKVEDVTFSYPSSYENIFEHVSFTLDTDWKLGFVGRNGRGKTTFLRLLAGQYAYSGKIMSSVPFAYFPYAVSDISRDTEEVLRDACPAAQEWEFLREFSELELDPNVLYRPFATLSDGERTKALMAALNVGEERFLLIDEPTNHLDMRARSVVSAYLQKKKGFILVSHDRSFLDGCVDHILSINRANIEVQSGNFSSWQENFLRRQAFEQGQNDRLHTEIKRLQQAKRRTAEWSNKAEKSKRGKAASGLKQDTGYVGHKAAKMMQQAKNIEARQTRAVEQKSALLRDTESTDALKFTYEPYRAEVLAEFVGVAPSYGGKAVCSPVTFRVCRGDRIALTGKNGSGKSSLLRLITGADTAHAGVVRVGSGLRISYVPQDASFLRGSLSETAQTYGLDESLFTAVLRKMGLTKEQLHKDLSEYSDGQKKKVLLAKSLCERANLYVWDEPLNYLDIYARVQLEEAIARFRPAMLFVEHDKTFTERIATAAVNL